MLKLIACNPSTQTPYVEDGLSKLIRYLVEADRPETHNHATAVFNSLAHNPQSHHAVVKNKLLPLLLVLRNSKDLESRRVSLDALLDFVENTAIHPLIKNEYDLVQTIVAISKFGINKSVKERAADCVLQLMDEARLPAHLARQQEVKKRKAKPKIPKLNLTQGSEEEDVPVKDTRSPDLEVHVTQEAEQPTVAELG